MFNSMFANPFAQYMQMMQQPGFGYQMPASGGSPLPAPYNEVSPMPYGGGTSPLPQAMGGGNLAGILQAMQQHRAAQPAHIQDPTQGPMPSRLSAIRSGGGGAPVAQSSGGYGNSPAQQYGVGFQNWLDGKGWGLGLPPGSARTISPHTGGMQGAFLRYQDSLDMNQGGE